MTAAPGGTLDAAAVHVVVYARHLAPLAAFYEQVLGLARLESAERFVLLGGAGFELSVVAMPPELAEGVTLAQPPVVREETPIKASFRVERIEACRSAVVAGGGTLKPAEAAWAWRGQRHLDGVDPEGNVFQLREVAGSG